MLLALQLSIRFRSQAAGNEVINLKRYHLIGRQPSPPSGSGSSSCGASSCPTAVTSRPRPSWTMSWTRPPCLLTHVREQKSPLHGERTAFTSHVSDQWPLKALCNTASHSPIHAHTYTHTHTQTTTASWSGAVSVWASRSGDTTTLTQLGGGAGDRTSNLPVTSQP